MATNDDGSNDGPVPTTRLQNALNEITLARQDDRVPDDEEEQLEGIGSDLYDVWHYLMTKENRDD